MLSGRLLPPIRFRSPATVLLALGTVALALGLTLELPESRGAIKGDESTFVAMAFSLAYDGDLDFDRDDLTRFRAALDRGPEGIFLKLGRDVDLRLVPTFPFVENAGRVEPGTSRVYFGKAWVHAAVAAPLVRLFGLNGLFLTNLLLLVAVVAAGYVFASAQCTPWMALALATGFIGASVAPIYTLWLTPEIVNLAFSFLAYFLFFYKDVAPAPTSRAGRWLRHPATDWAGVVLLALATFSKPPNVLLIGPLVVARFWQRELLRSIVLGAGFGLIVLASFGMNQAISGEMNYQGGERKTFYGSFPYESPDATFESRGIDMATDQAEGDEMFDRLEFWPRLSHNLGYFFVGRHFGLLPYHFPGLLLAVLWLSRPRRWTMWQAATALTVGATALVLLVYTPFSWSGGGGPLGNRYFLSIYPVLFFLLPPMTGAWTVGVMWLGGLACTWFALLHPLDVAYRPGLASRAGLNRLLPVELTMVNDLPLMLEANKGRIPYGQPPKDILLYYVDDNAWLPDQEGGIWVRGASRADIVLRSGDRPLRYIVTMRSLTETEVGVSLGGQTRRVTVRPGTRTTVVVPGDDAVFTRRSYSVLLKVSASRGARPKQVEPGSTDERDLGVQVKLEPVLAAAGR